MHFWFKIMIQGFFLAVFITGCKSKKTTIKKETPFSVIDATYQNWYGGNRNEKGVKIVVLGKDLQEKSILKTLYYKNKQSSISPKRKENHFVLEVKINTSEKGERILHEDTQSEYGNKPPVKSKYSNLKEDEVIIGFIKKGKEYTFKIKLKKGKDIFYP